jgi:hypothetical protein
MPPSDITYVENIKTFIKVATKEFLLKNGWPYIVVFLLAVLTILYTVFRERNGLTHYFREYTDKLVAIAVLVLYYVLGSFLVIYARSKYHMGEIINYRHLIQYNWILLAALLWTLFIFIRNLLPSLKGYIITRCVILIVGIFVIAHISYISIKRKDNVLARTIISSPKIIEYVRRLPQSTYVVSNAGPYFRILTEKSVRKLPENGRVIYSQKLAEDVCPYRDIVIVLVNNKEANYGFYGEDMKKTFTGYIPNKYQRVYLDSNFSILSCNRSNYLYKDGKQL